MLALSRQVLNGQANSLAFTRFFAQKTEKQKMLDGELYEASDPELVKERKRVRALIDIYNKTTSTDVEQRKELLNQIFQKETWEKAS